MEKWEKVYRLILLKILCYKKDDGKYIIFSHDELNTKRKIDEIMDIIKVAKEN